MSDAERARRAERLLARRGVAAQVEAVGFDGATAAVRADRAALSRVREAAPALRALGFRYVALDLAP